MSYKDKKVIRINPDIYTVLVNRARTERRSTNAQAELLLEQNLGPVVVTPVAQMDNPKAPKSTAGADKGRPVRRPRPRKDIVNA
jgi:hypothetical protein